MNISLAAIVTHDKQFYLQQLLTLSIPRVYQKIGSMTLKQF